MSGLLVITVRFHDGRFHGMPEWPPSPARLFQALIAGVGSDGLGERDGAALEWLESLPAPALAVPTVQEGRALTNYVPNNDSDSTQSKKTEKIIKAWMFDAEVPFLYVWRFDQSSEADNFADRICHIADHLYQLGRGVDMAWAWGETLDGTEAESRLNECPGIVYRPCESGSGVMLACPENGSLASLCERHVAQSKRFASVIGKKGQQIFTQPPKPRFRQVAYSSPSVLRLYDLIGTRVPWPLSRCAELTKLLRNAAATKLMDSPLDKKDMIERVLIGRGATEADKTARVRILPLPSIGHKHADHAIRRVLVEVPPNCPVRCDDIEWAFSGLAPEIDAETGEMLLGLVPAADLKMLGHYGIDTSYSARCWRTVTPVVLPEATARRRIDPSRMREEAKGGAERLSEQNRAVSAVLQALRHAGVRGRVDSVQVQREPFESNGARVETFAVGTRFPKERFWHVEVEFTNTVSGPVVVGDGRYLGLGVMAPLKRVEGIFAFNAVHGLTNAAEPMGISRACRRAVMFRLQDIVGRREKLPGFFTGHEPGGAPLRKGHHAHLAFVTDLVRNRILVIAPHIMEHRRPTYEERKNLEILAQALDGMSCLRAGESGLLKLAPVLVNVQDDPLFAPTKFWNSVTNYRLNRHAKRVSANEALVLDVQSEIRKLDLPEPAVVDATQLVEGPRGGLVGKLRLQFAVVVPGPMLIGRTRHFGGGLFAVDKSCRNSDNADHELAPSNPPLANAPSGGAGPHSSRTDTPARGDVDGDGGGAGGREFDQSATRPPQSATRHIETTHGVLTYAQLAPFLAERVAVTEDDIRRRLLSHLPLDDEFILDLHRRIAGELVPSIAGQWRKKDVIVGTLEPPPFPQVPILMRDYGRDLQVRFSHLPETPGELLLEALAFAESRLLWIHPFVDFNGRTTRLFLIEILYRLKLPIINPATELGAETERYLAALRAADRQDLRPLMNFWRYRFEREDLS